MWTILLPKHLDLHYFSNLLDELQKTTTFEIIMDWSNCTFFSKESYCGILHFRDIAQEREIEIRHLNNKTDIFEEIKPIWEYNFSDKENAEILFISPILKEESLFEDKILMKKFYGLEDSDLYDYTVLDSIFVELYMNICQHSEISKGYILVAPPNEAQECQIIFSDRGIGLVQKIKQFFVSENFLSDANVIEFATIHGITTKSTQQNQGKGLDNLVSQIKSLEGNLQIFSAQGLFSISNGVIKKTNFETNYHGTLINLSFNLKNLPEKEDNDYLGEI